MLLDARNTEVNLDLEADIAIVGGGVAGITLARKLSKHASVVLIESGGMGPDNETQALYDGEITGMPYSLTASRLRYLGGTSNHWGGWCGMFDDIDFEPRPWVPYSGWPIRHGDIRPYYDEAADILNLASARFNVEDLVSQDEPVLETGGKWLGHRIFRFSNPVARFGEKYRGELDHSQSIHVLTHANLVEIVPDDSGTRIAELAIRTLSGREGTIKPKTTILACGAIENARLLLASNARIPQGIGNQHDLVGRFFMEHPHIEMAYLAYHDTQWCHSARALRSDGEHWFGIGLTLPATALREYRCLNFTGQLFERDCNNESPMRFGAMTEQAPNPDSRITLSEQTDELGIPKARLAWQLTELDWYSIRTGGELIGRTFGALGLGRVRFNPDLLNWSPDRPLGYGSHHMGTTRMADSPSSGVVDADCKVHGMDNLYIAGSSVYATSAAINPTFTLTALALRLGDHLSSRLGY